MAKKKTVVTQVKRNVSSKRYCLSSTPVGHSLQTPTPPDFGEKKDAPGLVRVIKDVLRVGKWKIGLNGTQPIYWDVTDDVLNSLASTTSARINSGEAINFGKGHGDENLMISPDDLIAPVDDVRVSGGVLWASSYVTPEQAKYLENPAMKVSVGVLEDYYAGDGKRYPIALAHVAVTDRPVVTGQGKFLALANISGGSSMDFAALVQAINTLLSAIGVSSLPEEVNEASIVPTLQGIAIAVGNEEAEEPAGEEPVADPAADPMAAMQNQQRGIGMNNKSGSIVAQLSNLIDSKIKPLTDQIASLQSEKTGAAKAAFEAKLTDLGKAGVAAITLSNKRTLGAKYGWDLGLLDGIQPTIKMSNTGQRSANGSAQEIPDGTQKADSDEDVAKRLKARGIDPKFMPKVS